MLAGADADKGGQAQPQRLRLQQRHPAADHAGLLQLLNAPPARRGGQADALGDLRQRQGGIPLQQGQDFPVEAVYGKIFHKMTNR